METSRQKATKFLKGLETKMTKEELRDLQNFLEEFRKSIADEVKNAAIDRITQMIIF